MSVAVAVPSIAALERKPRTRVHVLTLTPFFPSIQDPTQGCFIAEPLARLEEFAIESHVIAVSPIYRGTREPCEEASEWQQYWAIPGTLGLLTSGRSVAGAIRKRVLAFHRKCPIGLIHAHAALPCGEAAMCLAHELGIPFIVSVHGLDVFSERQAGPWLQGWARKDSMRVYRAAERIVCISRRVSQVLPSALRDKARIIHNGVDTDVFAPRHEEASGGRILAVGNLIPTKGHALLVHAFASVLKAVPEAELQIMGDGPERARLQTLAASLAISSRVIFHGRQPRPAVARAMQNCSIFALPSHYEGLGCVYLEAMACGKPAIACAGQGIEDVIRDGQNGLLVPADDTNALTAALIAVLQDSRLRRRLGSAARDTIFQGHTLEHQARKLADVYQECIG